MIFSIYFVLILCQLVGAIEDNEYPEDIYGFTAKDIKGKPVDFSAYRGKVLLVVNVASECGYTDNHYRELVELQDAFKDGQFLVLAFPCNQFGAQEPKRNSAIERFAYQNYNTNFPLFSKIKTIGENAHPLYRWLRSSIGEEPNWNFCKYLIDKQGKVVKFVYSNVSPMAMLSDIEQLIFPNGQPVRKNEL